MSQSLYFQDSENDNFTWNHNFVLTTEQLKLLESHGGMNASILFYKQNLPAVYPITEYQHWNNSLQPSKM